MRYSALSLSIRTYNCVLHIFPPQLSLPPSYYLVICFSLHFSLPRVDIFLIARIFPHPCGARKNTTQSPVKYPHVLSTKLRIRCVLNDVKQGDQRNSMFVFNYYYYYYCSPQRTKEKLTQHNIAVWPNLTVLKGNAKPEALRRHEQLIRPLKSRRK